MKNQYFGDRRDFFKYDLLLDLAGCLPDQRLVLIPMLTPNDDSGEGKFIGYSHGERRGSLVDALHDAVASGKRNIQILRNLMPSFGVQFMPHRDTDYFRDTTRAEYFAAVPTQWLAGSVVFFDPDIGLETGTVTYMRERGVEKYLFYADLCGVWARASNDSVFVVYQHLQNDATKRVADVQRRLRDLTTHLAIASVWAVQWSDLAFLVAVRDGAVATRVRRTLDEHGRRHGGMLSELAVQPSRTSAAAGVGVSESSRVGLLAGGDMTQAPKMTNREVQSGTGRNPGSETVRLDDIVAYLNAVQIRATYGAVAQVVGGIAQSIGARLGGVEGQRQEASWVVNAKTGLPTNYLPKNWHGALRKNQDIIANGDDLRRRVVKWKAAGAPSRSTIADVPGASHTSVPALRKRPVSGPPPQPTPVEPLSVEDLADLRRKLTALLNSFDTTSGAQGEGIRKRINRLSRDGGPIPRAVAALMTTITEMRNSAEYESKVLSASECAVVRHAWQAIQEWAQSVRRV